MNVIFRIALIALSIVFLPSAKGEQVPTIRTVPINQGIEPDRLIFASIAGAVDAKTDDERQPHLDALRESAGTHYERLIPQLLIYGLKAQDMEHGMAAGLVVYHLRIPSADIIHAILPFLDTKDRIQRNQVRNWLMGMDERYGNERPDFSGYETVLKRASPEVVKSLISYMYERDQQAAVLSMARVYGDNAAEAEVVEKLKGDPMSALRQLADRSEWWAHLYVATVLERDSFLRTPELLEKLEQDENPLVREKVIQIKEQSLPEETPDSEK